jgi:hypothetical protein
MAINRFRFYIGPLGVLQPLPPLPQSYEPEVSNVFPGVEHVSLSGQSTLDTLGRVRRRWRFTWDRLLSEDEELFIQAAHRRTANAPLRLLDPRKRNLLPEDVSTGGSSTLTTAAFTDVGAATPAFLPGDVPLEFLGVHAGSINWPTVTNAQQLWATFEKMPIMTGSTYRFSVYAKGSTTFKLGVRPFDYLGMEQATVLDGTTSTATGVWQRFSWEYTPAVGVSSVYAGLNATGSGNITTTGWMVQIDESTLKNWTIGYGCPSVYVSPDLQGGYWRTRYHKAAISVVEV